MRGQKKAHVMELKALAPHCAAQSSALSLCGGCRGFLNSPLQVKTVFDMFIRSKVLEVYVTFECLWVETVHYLYPDFKIVSTAQASSFMQNIRKSYSSKTTIHFHILRWDTFIQVSSG